MKVRLLGPLDVVVDGRTLPVRGLRRQAVLAILALSAGEVVDAALTTFAVLANDESPVIARRSRRALAALRIRHGDWAKAAAALASLPDDRWRAALLPESAYRAGDPDRHAAHLGPWQAAVRAAAGEPMPAVDVLSGSDGPPRLRQQPRRRRARRGR